ncbi:MAG: InlB B-repeat-containing protein [Treponema sp.]|nr:InlB B-repeat-containing protein [Treponema sp.]
MKKKTKICGVCVTLAAVLLLSAALIVSCAESLSFDDLSVSQGKPNTDFRPPEMGSNILPPELPAAQLPERNNEPVEEMGYLQLNIVKENGVRTVLPGAAPTIVEYLVIPTNSSTSAEVTIARIAAASIGTAISVPVATYSVEVRGYATTGSNVVVAVGSASGVEVTASGTTGGPAAIAQHEVITGTLAGSGTFAWNFTLPTGDDVVDSATMTVTDWGSQSNTIPSTLIGVDVKTTAVNTTGVAIPSGYYYVDVTLRKASHRTQTYREIVHIANGLTSTWAKNNFAALSKNVYTVTFSDPSGGGTSPITGVTHNATIAKPTAPTYGGKTFGGWFIDSAATTREWIFSDHTWAGTSPPDPDPIPSADKVIYDLTLYAKWTPPFENGNLSLNVGFTLTGDKAFTLSVNPIVYTAANLYDGSANHIITATVDNAVAQGFANIVWYYLEDVAGTPTKRELSTGDTLSINLDTTIYTALRGQGEHPIIVEADVGGVTGYSATLTLKMQ